MISITFNNANVSSKSIKKIRSLANFLANEEGSEVSVNGVSQKAEAITAAPKPVEAPANKGKSNRD